MTCTVKIALVPLLPPLLLLPLVLPPLPLLLLLLPLPLLLPPLLPLLLASPAVGACERPIEGACVGA